ncbi:MAG: hypothetical protein ACRCWM_04175 [Sarcina sp.]
MNFIKKEFVILSLVGILFVPTVFETISLSPDKASLKKHSEIAIEKAETKDCYNMCPKHYNIGQ